MSCDISLVVTAHDETLVSGPTMAAADACVAVARDAGYSVETLIALDNATDRTTRWFGQPRFDHWTRMTFAEGDLGRVRNAILPRTAGRFIAFLDADDIFSENWLKSAADLLVAAEVRGDRVIAHPELNWLFDGAHSVYVKPDQDDPLFSPLHFYSTNYYDSLCMAPRAAHLEHPYVSRDIPNGLSFQDWQFSIETMAAGWRHCTARNTIIFKRRRDESLVSESRARRAIVRQLDAMAVDRVMDLRARADPATAPAPFAPETTGQDPVNASVPYSGAAFEYRVARARARRGHIPDRLAADYETIKPHFDHAFYLSAYPDILALEEIDPVAHYLRAGLRERRDPAPWFNTESYLARHPELFAPDAPHPFAHWITEGRAAGEAPPVCFGFDALADSIGLTPAEAFTAWSERYDDLLARLRFGPLGREVTRAARTEPLVEQGWQAALRLTLPPFHRKEISGRTAAMWHLIEAVDRTTADYVICVNRARFGTAPRIEGHIARALASGVAPDRILVITTDAPGPLPQGKLPTGVRTVDLAALVPPLVGDGRERTLVEFLRALKPRAVFNVNSRLLWDALRAYGDALAQTTDVYAVLLCNERNALGYWSGYPLKRVYRNFDQLAGIITDSDALRDDLIDRFAIPDADADRIITLHNPVDATIPSIRPRPRLPFARPQVFWAGRLDAQKRVDLLYAIAQAMPDVDFRVWGAAVMADTDLPPAPPNLSREGTYTNLRDLPLARASVWLYTSAWDGVPTMLLEVAMTGLPILASDVGGTREALPDTPDALMPADAPVDAWVAALRARIADPGPARAAAAALRDRLIAARSPEIHSEKLWAALDRSGS